MRTYRCVICQQHASVAATIAWAGAASAHLHESADHAGGGQRRWLELGLALLFRRRCATIRVRIFLCRVRTTRLQLGGLALALLRHGGNSLGLIHLTEVEIPLPLRRRQLQGQALLLDSLLVGYAAVTRRAGSAHRGRLDAMHE